ncbi:MULTISPECIES: DUF5081 family protein [unclassified Granulicatella]|uniref:DUF5081 family protein n=1 Tax=unclassified Granulicatella TaxID=2630493 RepID=UPI0010749343|nr:MULTISPECIES: DUF5081 family protein [unclassified Granulicatella]MBF0780475.1 DUF5081 family protein [Granulicatella sp. 19428wC4_WM01]TFU95374.1 DUF5081 family protein [Granulicatella sp. WM01]
MERVDYFSIYELYFLLDVLDGQLLMGLPTRDDLTISSEDAWKEAKNHLEEKGFVNEQGELTQAGFVIVEILREYSVGKSLTIINNVYMMNSHDIEMAIVIVDTQEGYQLLKISQMSVLALLQEKLPVMLREPNEEEQRFLTLPLQMTKSYEELFLSDNTIVVQYYPLSDMIDTHSKETLYKQLLFVEDEDKLLGYDVREEQLKRYSQYYFLEQLYTWLNIPFKEEEFVE